MKFILVKCSKGYHVVPINQILFVCPYDGTTNISEIRLIGNNASLYSSDSQEEIFNKIHKQLNSLF